MNKKVGMVLLMTTFVGANTSAKVHSVFAEDEMDQICANLVDYGLESVRSQAVEIVNKRRGLEEQKIFSEYFNHVTCGADPFLFYVLKRTPKLFRTYVDEFKPNLNYPLSLGGGITKTPLDIAQEEMHDTRYKYKYMHRVLSKSGAKSCAELEIAPFCSDGN